MTRSIDLDLKPGTAPGITINTYTYTRDTGCRAMSEEVYLSVNHSHGYTKVELTADEARMLAKQLLQAADLVDEQRSLNESLAEIEEQLRDPDFDSSAVTYCHPDVLYVEPGQMTAAMQANPHKLLIARAAS